MDEVILTGQEVRELIALLLDVRDVLEGDSDQWLLDDEVREMAIRLIDRLDEGGGSKAN